MAIMQRVLDPEPVESLEAYVGAGGGKGLQAARKLGPAATIEEITASALREVVDGREPFPRIAPPYRRGVDDVGPDPVSGAGSVMATPGGQTPAAPALVNNAETLANVPGILASGAAWFREAGTAGSPGTVVCTVSGGGRRAGVAEFEMGTPLREVIENVGGPGRPIQAVLSGVANPFLPAARLDT